MKIFDTFTFFNELDLLELRFEILDPYVDYFILVESHQTFSGVPKPLYFSDNREKFLEKITLKGDEYDSEAFDEYLSDKKFNLERYKKRLLNIKKEKWNKKIIHIVVPDIEVTDGNLFQRHYLCYEAIESKIMELREDGDVVFCSDLDEIWNPAILSKIDDNPHSLIQYNYSYYLNYLSNEEWTGSLMSKANEIYHGYNKLNRTAKPFPLRDGGWHFSNQGGVEQIIKKLEAYDHSNEVLPMLSHFEGYGIKDRMEKGCDFLGRQFNYQGVPFEFHVSEEEWPQYLKDNREKYLKWLK